MASVLSPADDYDRPRTDTKVLPYHRPIVFACATVVLSRHCIGRGQQQFFKEKPK